MNAQQQFFISMVINAAIAITMLVAAGINLLATWRKGRTLEGWLHTAVWGLLALYALFTSALSLINYLGVRNLLVDKLILGRNMEALLLLLLICVLLVLPRLRPELFPKSLYLFRAMAVSGVEVRAELERVRSQTHALLRSNDSLEKFAFAVSHDLRDPINRIRGLLSILLEDFPVEGEAREIMDRIIRAGDEAEAQVEALLQFYRVNRDLKIEDCQLNEILLTVLAVFPPFEIEVGELPVVRADRRLMGIVIQNLLSNAVKFSDGQPVRISGETKGNEHVIRVADKGIGIAPEFLEEIFLIFRRLHGASEYPGAGLGLSLVQRIIEAHGGRVWAESKPGAGSEFFFTLPVA